MRCQVFLSSSPSRWMRNPCHCRLKIPTSYCLNFPSFWTKGKRNKFALYLWVLNESRQGESTLATIRHRTRRSKGCLSRKGMLCMMFKLGLCVQHNWCRLRGFKQLGKVIERVQFKDGIETKQFDNQVAAYFRPAHYFRSKLITSRCGLRILS